MKVFNKISFFQDLQNKIPLTHVRHLIKEFKYEFKERGDVVFQYGEFGANYYILLKGSLFLLLPKSTLNVDYTPEKSFVAAQYLTEPIPSPISNVIKGVSHQNIEENKSSPTMDGKLKLKIDTPKGTPKSILPTNRNSHVSPSMKRKFTKFNEEAMKKKSIISSTVLRDVEKDLMATIRQTFQDFEITKKLEAVTGFGEIALMSNLKRFNFNDFLLIFFLFFEFFNIFIIFN